MNTRPRHGRKWLMIGLLIVLLVGGYFYWALYQPLPLLQPTTVNLPTQSTVSKLTWPAEQSAIGIVGSSILETHAIQTAVPIASTAKLITAMVVLQAKPLQPGQAGSVLALSATDAALYNSYVAQGGSVVKVDIGEQISELQVLQAMMLPSANNLADSLAIWAFGSLSAYKTAATAWLAQHNPTQTHIGSDASGFSPTTISTAHDLVLLGELVMQTPVLANIVGQSSVSGIPVVGTIKNVNFLLGSYGIIGIKTGNNNQDPGVYVSASQTTINNQKVTLVTSLVGAPALRQALNDSLPLIKSAQANFQSVSVIKAGTVVGYYHSPWGVVVTAIASKDLAVTFWGGSTVSSSVNLQPVSADSEAGAVAGSLSAPASFLTGKQSALIKLQSPTSKPSLRWRLLHPIK